jgi:hypothetical protein
MVSESFPTTGRIDKETHCVEFVVVLTLGLEPEANTTDFEVAPLRIDGNDGDTKKAFPPPSPTPSTAHDKAFLEFSASGIQVFTPATRSR